MARYKNMLHCNFIQFYLETHQVIFFLLLQIEYVQKFQHCCYWKMLFHLLCDPNPKSPLHTPKEHHQNYN